MDKKETIRIAIMAGILAVFFGIRQTLSKETFEVINMDFALNFLSINFFQLLLWIYLAYFLVIALNSGHKNAIKFKKSERFLFDFIITITIMLVIMTFSLIGVIQLTIIFPNHIQPGWITNIFLFGAIIISAIFFSKNLSYYSKKIWKYLKIDKKY